MVCLFILYDRCHACWHRSFVIGALVLCIFLVVLKKCKYLSSYYCIDIDVKHAVNPFWLNDAIWPLGTWATLVMLVAWVHQAITLTSLDLLSLGMDPLGTDFHEVLFQILIFSLKKTAFQNVARKMLVILFKPWWVKNHPLWKNKTCMCIVLITKSSEIYYTLYGLLVQVCGVCVQCIKKQNTPAMQSVVNVKCIRTYRQ